jgi:hypothetical protein
MSRLRDEIFEWLATILIVCGATMTSMNYYPANIFTIFAGSLVWAYVGWLWGKKSLIFLNVTFIIIYAVGIIKWFTHVS